MSCVSLASERLCNEEPPLARALIIKTRLLILFDDGKVLAIPNKWECLRSVIESGNLVLN